jgi:hypothetical protein
MGDEDLGWRYSVRIVRRGGDMLLVGSPNADRRLPELQIGRVNGTTDGFAKVNLNPGWRLTKRAYNGQTIGHVYLTSDRSLSSVIAAAPTVPTVPTVPTRPTVPVLPKPPVKPSVPIPVPKPETSKPSTPVSTKPSTPLPKPPVPPTTQPRPTRPVGDFVVPTIEIPR